MKPVLIKNRTQLIRQAIKKLQNPTTRKVQEYVLKHFGIKVSQPLIAIPAKLESREKRNTAQNGHQRIRRRR